MINRQTLMNYAQNLKGFTLTEQEAREVVWSYLMKHYEGDTTWPGWPQEIKDLCASAGIIQDKETGLPMAYEHIGQAWSTRCVVAEANLQAAQYVAEQLTIENQMLKDRLNAGALNVH